MALSARSIAQIEKLHPEGLSSKQILQVLSEHGERLTEATLRKYVQLGLLPRSRRVGQKGKHRGSKGIYPVLVIRRVDEIRRAMDRGQTLEDLARATQTSRAKLSNLRAAIDEVVSAAESELQTRPIERKRRVKLKGNLARMQKTARAWLQEMDAFTALLDQENGSEGPGALPAGSARVNTSRVRSTSRSGR